jgi:hypothetical protein
MDAATEDQIYRLIVRQQELTNQLNELQTKFAAIEHFVKDQFPGFFAGDAGTITDPELHPVPITYGNPRELAPNELRAIERCNNGNAQ